MFKRGDREFVLDMFLACRKVLDYTEGLSFREFARDDKTIDAVIRNIEILGEAAKNISEEFRDRYPHIEWSKIARTRDKLIHFYFGVNKEIVWDIGKENIPELLNDLRHIIQREGWSDEIL